MFSATSTYSQSNKFMKPKNATFGDPQGLFSLNQTPPPPKKIELCREKQADDFVAKLYGDPTFADVIFKVEDQEFPANKCILSARCSYFKKAFTSNMMESHNKEIPIKDVPAKLFKGEYFFIESTKVLNCS